MHGSLSLCLMCPHDKLPGSPHLIRLINTTIKGPTLRLVYLTLLGYTHNLCPFINCENTFYSCRLFVSLHIYLCVCLCVCVCVCRCVQVCASPRGIRAASLLVLLSHGQCAGVIIHNPPKIYKTTY